MNTKRTRDLIKCVEGKQTKFKINIATYISSGVHLRDCSKDLLACRVFLKAKEDTVEEAVKTI